MDAVIDQTLFQVYVNGSALPENVQNSLAEIRIQQRLSQPALCELYFLDAKLFEGNPNLSSPGQTLTVALAGSPKMLFSGDITAVEHQYSSAGETSVFLRAYDFMRRLRTGPNTQGYAQASLFQVVKNVASQNNVRFSLAGIENSDPFHWPLLIQYNQSDLDFVVEQAYRLGYYFTTKGDVMYALTLAGLPENPVRVAYRDNLRRASLEINQGKAFRNVKVEGWNIETAQPISARANKSSFDRSFNQNGTTQLKPTLPGIQMRNQVVVSERHAQALAQAELDRCYSSGWTLRGVADGSPEFYPGRRVLVEGVAPDAVGYYVLTEVTHVYNQSGYTVELSTALPELTLRPQVSVITLGQVIDVDDPLRNGRVKVALPVIDTDITLWLPVALPGVGEEHGFAISQEVGDKVLVMVMTDNPGMGVVLGGLYGREKPPAEWENPLDLGAKTYSWVSPHNQKIQLRDGPTSNAIRLQVDGGAYIELDGKKITIAGGTIDFERL